MYAVVEGRREELPHPLEESAARQLTGKSLQELMAEDRLGFLHPYLCTNCREISYLDQKRDAISCPHCGDTCARCGNRVEGTVCGHCGAPHRPELRMKAVADLMGKPCPRCWQGTFERELEKIS
jgi:DNA-directed RNA polymerase subunit RPC12/RpoP